MLFGVHNHYNNNSDGIGALKHPCGYPIFSESPVRVTDQGFVVFNLSKRLDLDEKIRLAALLDAKLKTEFGTGLSFATCAASLCTKETELSPFYQRMKTEINPETVTIFATSKFEDRWIGCPVDLCVDHLVNNGNHQQVVNEIVGILSPSEADMTTPPEGWRDFESKLERLFAAAKTELAPKKAALIGITARTNRPVSP